MPDFWKVVNKVIDQSDIILEVMDARQIDLTRNAEIENKVKAKGKRLIYVFNKCDLVDIKLLKEEKKILKPSIFISAKEHEGTKMLREAILKNSGSKKEVFVGVLGYPNTGKSSLINALVGRNCASTSPESGHTKGLKHLRVSSRIKLIDTPGVIPYREKNNAKHGIIGSIDYAKIKNPQEVVETILEEYPAIIEQYYQVDANEDPEEVLNEIALKHNHLKKGGVGDIDKVCRMILKAWQKGAITH